MSNMTNVLVTGGAGFIGSNLVEYLLDNHPEYKVFVLDKLTYAGDMNNLKAVESNPRFKFIKGDICNAGLVEHIFSEYDIRGVFHLAAETHVDNSIEGPRAFMETNFMGTFTLVSEAYRHWMNGPDDVKEGYENCRFHHTSTDEVYGTLGDTGLFSETTAYAPNPPYAASKAGSDFIVRSYNRTFGLNATITNCSNNYGPNQHDEKLIPTVIRKALSGENIPIFGDGKNIRDWLYVKDHCNALTTVFHNGRSGETYNIGCDNERDNNYIAEKLCTLLDDMAPKLSGSYTDQISYVKDRAGHDRRYAIDATKITTELKWTFTKDFEEGLRETVQAYINKYQNDTVKVAV